MLHQDVKGLHRRIHLQRLNVMRMLQLQQLHGPFDIRQASPAEFEMPVASHTTWQTLRLHTRRTAYRLATTAA